VSRVDPPDRVRTAAPGAARLEPIPRSGGPEPGGAAVATNSEFDKVVQDLADGGGPVLEALGRMNAGFLDSRELDERTVLLMRFAALVALDAPAQSYLVTLAVADKSGIPPETVQAALIALAPVVGGPRIVAAAGKVQEAVRLAGG